jgi:two-component system, NarL family, sensor histidine kinase DesK
MSSSTPAHGGDATSVAAMSVTPEWTVSPRWRRGWPWAAIWLIFLVQPLVDVFHRPYVWQRLAGGLAIALFAATYVVSFVLMRARRQRTGLGPPLLEAWAYVGLMLICTAVLVGALGRPAFGVLVYAAVVAVFSLPTRPAAAVAVLIAATPVVVPLLVPGWKSDFASSLTVVVATVAVWGVAQLVERNGQLAAAREEITRLAIANERNRFARDLHDLLGHSLTVIAVKAELAGRLVQLSPERAEAEIADVERLAREALRDVRDAVAGYRETSLDDELASARSALLAAGIEADVPGNADGVPASHRELFAWAVREGVTNVVRHSGASRCRIRVGANEVEIVDNGQGPGGVLVPAGHGSSSRHGHGLVGLRERAEATGATVEVGRPADGGFELRVRVP